MQLKPETESEYESYKSNNSDPYGAAVVEYSERWADMMEAEMAAGKKLADVAEQTSHSADTDGITGFMYGCAVKGLAYFWIHGEELRRWHNIGTQLGHEGEAANASGGVLNSAIIDIG